MSYEIIYDKCFIKAEKEGKEVFFPMIYWGSNNCTDYNGKNGAERRERYWHNFTYHLNNKRYGTLKEMLDSIDKKRERVIATNKERNDEYRSRGETNWIDEYDDKRWGYFTSIAIGGASTHRTSFACYKGIFTTGCKKALTVEELRELNVFVSIRTSSFYYMEEELKRYKEAGKEEIDITVKTSKELIEKLEELEEYLKDFPKVYLYINLSADEEKMRRVRKDRFPTKATKPKERKEVDEYFVITFSRGYLYKRTRRGFEYTPYANSGKKFLTEKDASKYLKEINKNTFCANYNFQVEKVNQKVTVYV